eukprot:scaffold3768_cov376-Prasinococcus_capsulatus_cf.AAC.13
MSSLRSGSSSTLPPLPFGMKPGSVSEHLYNTYSPDVQVSTTSASTKASSTMDVLALFGMKTPERQWPREP